MVTDAWWVMGVILGLTAITVISRSAFLVLGDYIPLPEALRRGLRYAPACALVAIVVPDLFLPGGQWAPVLENARLYAALAAVAVFLAVRNMVVGIFAGMATLWLVRWALG